MKKLIPILAAMMVALSLVVGMILADEGKKATEPKTEIADIDQQLEMVRAAIAARAGEQIKWQVIAAGATDGSSTSYGVKGTVGQVVIGEGSSSNYDLRHGYWQNFAGGGDCCMGAIRGNVDYDPGDVIDISDLVYLVDFMFNSGPVPPCCEESDIDGSGGSTIDIADLVHLVDYMFTGGPPPEACP